MDDKEYHRLLKRQIKQFIKPELVEEIGPFLDAISDFYTDAENQRKLLERTLDISSKELEDANRSLKEQNKALRAQEELRASRDEAVIAMNQAQEANRAKDTFLSNMSHELRTPLNAIIGFSQIMLAKQDTPDSVKIFVDKIHLAGKNLLSLVNTILDFSKIESGKTEIHKTFFSMNDLIKEANILIEPMAENKEIECVVEMEDQIEIYADRQLIKQVIINLMSNAIKFSPEKEKITFMHHHEEDREIFVVIDKGHGIGEDKITAIFDPFVQVREHQNNAIKGTGLGLSIVKKILELHGGNIWVESTVGEGSRFYFTLPVSTAENAE